jgi:hypothetical protein
MDAVLTVSPRRDHDLFDEDLGESLVTCTVQIDAREKSIWSLLSEGMREQFMSDFVTQVIEMRIALTLAKYEMGGENFFRVSPPPHDAHLSPSSSSRHKKMPSKPSSLPPPSNNVVTTQPGDKPHKNTAHDATTTNPGLPKSFYMSYPFSLVHFSEREYSRHPRGPLARHE